MKVVNGKIYIHKSALGQLDPIDIMRIQTVKESIPEGFKYEVISIDKKEREIAFTDSPDWNESWEPLVGDRIVFILDKGWRKIKKMETRKGNKNNPFIYHRRYLFVGPNYKGFNVEADKKRGAILDTLGLDLTRIGRRDYWNKIIAEHNL